jgi:hypothetical protein
MIKSYDDQQRGLLKITYDKLITILDTLIEWQEMIDLIP